LLAELPLDVALKSITYLPTVVQVPVSGMRQSRASYPGGYWLYAYPASEALRKDVCEQELELKRATVARVIFERLVKEGRAGCTLHSYTR
jgi:hypothetical protein